MLFRHRESQGSHEIDDFFLDFASSRCVFTVENDQKSQNCIFIVTVSVHFSLKMILNDFVHKLINFISGNNKSLLHHFVWILDTLSS